MEPAVDGWNIVLLGAWNPAILTPPWLAKHVLDADSVPVELSLSLGSIEERQISFPDHGFRLAVQPGKLVLTPFSLNHAHIIKAQTVAVVLLEKLSHTPVSGVGVNYRFAHRGALAAAEPVFDLPDSDGLVELGLAVRQTQVIRKLEGVAIFGRPLLNLRMTSDLDDGEIRFDLNYHYAVESADVAAKKLAGAFEGLVDHAKHIVFGYSTVEVTYDNK